MNQNCKKMEPEKPARRFNVIKWTWPAPHYLKANLIISRQTPERENMQRKTLCLGNSVKSHRKGDLWQSDQWFFLIFSFQIVHILFKNIYFIYFLRDGKGRRKTGTETLMWDRNIYQLPLACVPTGDQTCNPVTCLDQRSNQWPFAL